MEVGSVDVPTAGCCGEWRHLLLSCTLKSNMIQCSQYFTLIKAIKNLQEKETI
jgi:hypothetical protein